MTSTSSEIFSSTPNCWAILVAAGKGARVGGTIPKQYLRLAQKTVLEHSLSRLLNYPKFSQVVVVLSPDDVHWPTLPSPSSEHVAIVQGGTERFHSVLNGLAFLANRAQPNDWVLVHDAVRPCVRITDIDRLFTEVQQHPVGGLLGIPVRDTLKLADEQKQIIRTVSRQQLWQAQTPQLFRYGKLYTALISAIENQKAVTDEASALELLGEQPLMVAGASDNIKITYAEDLVLAEQILFMQLRDGMTI